MTSFPRHAVVVASLAVSALTACSGATRAPELSPIERARADSARLPYTVADIRFMTHMIGHHSQAVVMSKMAPASGASGQVKVLAERIINAQDDEIALMQQWLRERRQPVPEAKPMLTMKHVMNGMEHEMPMPGMLTDAQMKQLESARGPEFEKLFLTFMIAHHRGAVEMVKELFDTNGGQDETVFKFASDVNVDQSTEIARMEKMLAVLLFGPPISSSPQ